jgi:transposase
MKRIHSIGIDVSKDTLDVSTPECKFFSVPNTKEGIDQLAESLPKEHKVYLESTGGYERLCGELLTKEGFTVELVDPLKARRFFQSQARKAKTDKLDAVALGQYGADLPTRRPKTPEEMHRQDLARARESLRDTARECRQKANAPGLAQCAKDAFLQVAQAAEAQAKAIQSQLEKELRAGEQGSRYRNLLTVPGVGPILALTLLSELPPDWENRTNAQLVSYSGLAPLDSQSGRLRKSSRLGRGNVHIKAALYTPALSVLRVHSWAKTLYDNLKTKGRTHQQAIVAIMRRLLVRALAVLKRNSPWIPNDEKA